MSQAFIGLGANLGDARQILRDAIAACGALPMTTVRACSSSYETTPIDADGDNYINAVIELETEFGAMELLAELQRIENQHGRTRSYRNAPRTLDCDLLLFGQQVIDTPTLIVPHPRLHQRAFVLVPLAEIAPELILPIHGSVSSLLSSVADQKIIKIT